MPSTDFANSAVPVVAYHSRFLVCGCQRNSLCRCCDLYSLTFVGNKCAFKGKGYYSGALRDFGGQFDGRICAFERPVRPLHLFIIFH